MKKFNITSKELAIASFTTVQILCVFIAAAFALQSEACTSPYWDAFGCISYLGAAIIFEWVKYKVTHNVEEQYNDEEQ